MSVKRAFAEGTSVAVERSKAEIESVLNRYGATGFASARDGLRNRIEFVANARRVRFDLTLPGPEDDRFKYARRSTWRLAPASARQERWEAEQRRLWRALLLAIKAKLEVVESGMAIFEEEFMANIVMPDGRTVGQHAMPAIAKAYQSGRVVALLPAAVDVETEP